MRSVLTGKLEFESATVLTDRNVLHQVHLDCAPWDRRTISGGDAPTIDCGNVVVNAFAQPYKRQGCGLMRCWQAEGLFFFCPALWTTRCSGITRCQNR